jgi:hypothetical protein
VVFDDSFSTVHCLQTNKIPANWPKLFKDSAVSFVDEDFTKTNMYDCTRFQHPSQRESTFSSLSNSSSNVPVTVPVSTSMGPLNSSIAPTNAPIAMPVDMHSNTITSPLSLQKEVSNDCIVVTSNGWNSSHPYNTRFKLRFHANLAPTTPLLEQTASLDFSTISAVLVTHDHLPITSNNTLFNLPYLAIDAQSNPDILHFGAMQHALYCLILSKIWIVKYPISLIMAVLKFSHVPLFLLMRNLAKLFGVFVGNMPLIGLLPNVDLACAHMAVNKLKA